MRRPYRCHRRWRHGCLRHSEPQARRRTDGRRDPKAPRLVESSRSEIHKRRDGQIRFARFLRCDWRSYGCARVVCISNSASNSCAGNSARAIGKDSMKLTGAEILCESLTKLGVQHIFGYPGGAILPVYDALGKSKLHHILVRHEQGATHMADGYARATGGVGVAMATSGPGATNMVTGIATAMLDSSPVVCITGQVSSKLLGSDAFQEIDITGITMP